MMPATTTDVIFLILSFLPTRLLMRCNLLVELDNFGLGLWDEFIAAIDKGCKSSFVDNLFVDNFVLDN